MWTDRGGSRALLLHAGTGTGKTTQAVAAMYEALGVKRGSPLPKPEAWPIVVFVANLRCV